MTVITIVLDTNLNPESLNLWHNQSEEFLAAQLCIMELISSEEH